MKKYNYYLAGPFFTPDQLEQQKHIETMFKMAELNVFSPRLDAGTLPENAKRPDMYKVFMADLEAIDNSEILFANISFRDTGTAVEIGYALAKKIPVILFWDELLHDTKKVNLMLAMACDGNVITKWLDLGDYIITKRLPNADLYFEVE